MITIEYQSLPDVMSWAFIAAIVLICAVLLVDWFVRTVWFAVHESPEEQAQREADRISRQATKEYKRRQRLRNGWFWKF